MSDRLRPLSSLPIAERERRVAEIARAIQHILKPEALATVAARSALTAVGR